MAGKCTPKQLVIHNIILHECGKKSLSHLLHSLLKASIYSVWYTEISQTGLGKVRISYQTIFLKRGFQRVNVKKEPHQEQVISESL